MGGNGVMAEYNWYKPTTWDMQNNPAYRAGESYYNLTQGENAAPVNEDTWQFAKDVGPIYKDAWDTRAKPAIKQAGAGFYEDVQNEGGITAALAAKLKNLKTPLPFTDATYWRCF